jgi:4-alpha-glucanotransferase
LHTGSEDDGGTPRPRQAGLLLHPTALPGRFSIGDIGPAAEDFLEWAARAGQTIWQILPLGPVGRLGSPYDSRSAFAGNTLLVSPERLVDEGWLLPGELRKAPRAGAWADYTKAAAWKERLLRIAWAHFETRASATARTQMHAFVEHPDQAPWLEDWALFAALEQRHKGAAWRHWDPDLARRKTGPLSRARRELREELSFHRFGQFVFFRQWDRIRARAGELGIQILGDLPLYVATDSADVWAHSRYFQLDPMGRPKAVSGVPPDYFSPHGQRWGNPLYRWDRMRDAGYSWWVARMRANVRFADIIRIDHFRGLASYWAVPAAQKTAERGEWLPGPGLSLFRAMEGTLGPLPVVAEDLGLITPDVRALRAETGYPGMKVLQFAFDEADSEHLPHRYERNSVIYTGTHDNDTTRGWFGKSGAARQRRALEYLGARRDQIVQAMIRAAYLSVADRAIVPMQDVFKLGSVARMNTPGKARGNWRWRARAASFTEKAAAKLRELAELAGRNSGPGAP